MLRWLGNFLAPGRFPAPPLPDPARPMTAIVFYEHGDADVLQLVNDFPSPSPAPGSRQVLVQVCAAGLNPLDFKMRKGPIANFLYPKPKISGLDISGKVISSPPGSSFKPGDKVYAMLPLLCTQYGGYASVCCVDEDLLALAPDNVDLVSLASIPLVANTVVQAMRPVVQSFHGDTKGKKCVIQAGSGGVGTFAIQYCAKVFKY
jgi:NADPH:quinone reductase-like Zn-dependent oxidoreductase